MAEGDFDGTIYVAQRREKCEIDAIEKSLDRLFERKAEAIPWNERADLYGRILALDPRNNHERTVTIVKKFTHLNVFPIDFDPVLWSTL